MALNPEDVVQFLHANPDFLAANGDLFTQLTVPHPQHGGQAISLAERQLHALRDKIRQLEMKLAELIRFGEQNDDIGGKVHRLGLALLAARDAAALRHAVLFSLREDFAVPEVALHFWADEGESAESIDADSRWRKLCAALERPYCGAPEKVEMLACFGEAGAQVRSLALIPLREGSRSVGVLALGSPEAERFYADMGSFFLRRIGELVTAAWSAGHAA